ncbi:MAG: ArnT family glycosyltransferase [Candidatus Heimdallarchaeota archaeon]
MSSRQKDISIAVGILVFALAARIYKLMVDVAGNGVDEGIHLMQGRLLAEGFSLYDQTFSLQAPVAIFLYALIRGDVFLAKLLSIFSSLVTIAFIMYMARKLTDTLGMTISGLLLSAELYFLKESRLASIDMLCTTFLVIGFFFLFRYVEGENRFNLAPAGFFFAAASLTKLIAVLPTISVIIYLLWKERRRSIPFLIAIATTTAAVLAPLNLQAAFEQMILAHTHKEWRGIFDRIFILGTYVLLNIVLITLACVGIWTLLQEHKEGKNRIRRDFLFLWLFSIAFFVIALNSVMAHHLILLSPVLALLAAYGGTKISSLDIWPSNFSQFWPSRFSNVQIDRPKVVAAVMGVVLFITTLNVAIISSVVFLEPKPRENPTYLAAEILEIITTPDDLVISGDPEIALLAGRNVPPELVDTAENRYPHLTGEYLVNRTLEYNITAVVVAYIMIDFIEYIEFLDAHYTRDLRAWDIDPAILQDLEDQDVLIYVKPDFSRVL